MLHLLLVDDNVDDSEITKIHLRKISSDLKIVTAKSATEALEILKNQNIDCVISDYQMPGMDGLELLKAMRSTRMDVPFILLTGHGDEKVATRALRTGADDYFTKRMDLVKFERLLNSINQSVKAHNDRRALLESESKYHTIVDAVDDIIFITTGDSFLFVNKAAAEISGYSEDELLAMNPFDVVHPDDTDRLMEISRKRLAGEDAPQIYQARFVSKKGKTRHIEIAGHRITYNNQAAILGVARDITERHYLREIEKEKGFSEAVMNSLPGIFYVFDETGCYYLWNNSYTNKTGYSMEEMSSMHAFDFLAEEDRKHVAEKMQNVLTGECVTTCARLIHKDGSVHSYFLSGCLMVMDEKKFIVGEGIDIEEFERSVAECRKRQNKNETLKSNTPTL